MSISICLTPAVNLLIKSIFFLLNLFNLFILSINSSHSFNGYNSKQELKTALDKAENDKEIIGLLRKIYKPSMFKPDNDIKNNIWFSLNLEDLKEATGEQFNEFVIFLEDKQANLPLPKKISIDVPNNHLKYAITWYAISISIIFYYLYFRRKK